MKVDRKCKHCGETKKIEDFPKRGNETDRLGNPLYRGICKKCEAEKKTAKNRQNKLVKNKVPKKAPITTPPIEYQTTPKEKKSYSDQDDYNAWQQFLGRELSEEERAEVDTCARELIITMMDLVIKEKEFSNE